MADSHSIALGDTFNRWAYIGPNPDPSKRNTALFRCICGTERFVNIRSVTQGRSKSCGCQRVDSARQLWTTHGRSQDSAGSPYVTWSSLFGRCYNPKNPNYDNYGGRGITVCDRWRESFENFLADMGERPPGTSLDRRDNDLGYSKENCRWATQTEQMFNTRQTLKIEHEGKTVTIGDLAKESGVSPDVVRRRIADGIPVEKAVSKESLSNFHIVEHGGLSMTIAEWTRKLGMNRGVIETRLRRGKSVAEALAPVKPNHRKK